MAKKKGLLESMSSEKQEEQKNELTFDQLEDQKTEEPKQDDTKTEESKQDNTKTEEPKQETLKAEEPKQDNAKIEEPKQETLKAEEPKQDNAKIEEPKQAAPKAAPKKEVKRTDTNKISVFFNENSPVVQYVLLSTQHQDKVVAAGKQLKMLKGRGYMVPVNSTLNSDDMTSIKVFSDMADKIDVRFVKDGYAFIIPLQHNIILTNDQRLALLS